MSARALVAGLSLLSLLPTFVQASTYHLAHEYAGQNFFDEWVFYGHADNMTHGNANFVDAKTAKDKNLAFVNDQGNAIMRVDNTTELKFGQNRDTIHIHTKDKFSVGSVWIADMLHVPYGCSVWPAFWSVAPNWPTGGEIDTFESVNMAERNQMTLHATEGCEQKNPVQSSKIINSTNCDYLANFNEGCAVTDPCTSSNGKEFAENGGGMFVTEFAETGISIWFFNRSSIPEYLQGNASIIDITKLGIPVSNWPSSGCSINRYYAAQRLVFDITLCGDLAGLQTKFMETCKGDCYHDYVLGPPSYYDNAYFEVKSVRVYGNGRNARFVGKSGAIAGAASAGWRWAVQAGAALFGSVLVESVLGL